MRGARPKNLGQNLAFDSKEGNGLHKGGLLVGLYHDAGGRDLLFMGSNRVTRS